MEKRVSFFLYLNYITKFDKVKKNRSTKMSSVSCIFSLMYKNCTIIRY
nr:MAG TPA: hypothetical protein [Caudoviricetes sp.]